MTFTSWPQLGSSSWSGCNQEAQLQSGSSSWSKWSKWGCLSCTFIIKFCRITLQFYWSP